MGYGGTGYATVSVDIVQTDVEAIIDGLCGVEGRTFTDIEDRLVDVEGHLHSNGTSLAQYLANIEFDTSDIEYCLGDSYHGPLYYYGTPLAQMVSYVQSDIYNLDYSLNDYYNGSLRYYGTPVAQMLSYLQGDVGDIEYYLSGGNDGPLTEIRNLLNGLGDADDDGALWDDGTSAAALLSSVLAKLTELDAAVDGIKTTVDGIKAKTDHFAFDVNNNLKVATTPQA